ncbi:MFS transporter [Streptococcus massiliensis]|uniref:Arabinose efflux permease n=1 Tax=Streptococcus massiliensis TaxID=313439 RepID=A0A380L0U0_9STRE|nr:MFS transporter [Streptococcus massiliensis]SUN76964.1 arabinose efflux permease [Streptococcus massiliensis]
MKRFLEKASILGLSLILTTAFSISSALPAMVDFYREKTPNQVELLVSLPSVGIMVMLLFNTWIERFLNEHQIITSGLLLLSLCGFAPFISRDYDFIFLSRFLFGLGVGLINAKAISIISERYSGQERLQMLGYRGSAEVVGTALLTLAVGQLLQFGWASTFLIYSFGFVILACYLLFVPQREEKVGSLASKNKTKMARQQYKLTIFLSAIAAVIVCTNVAITLRVPGLVVRSGMGTAQLASWILSGMQLTGILAGISFAGLTGRYQKRLLMLAALTFGCAQIVIGFSFNPLLLIMSTLVAGFSYSISLTAIFHQVSENIPHTSLNQATSIVVLGCSLGASATTFVLSFIDRLSNSTILLFSLLGGFMIASALLAGLTNHTEEDESHAS